MGGPILIPRHPPCLRHTHARAPAREATGMATHDIAAIVAAVIAAMDAPASDAPASAPAQPRVASPFVRVTGGSTASDTRPAVVREALRLWPGDRASQKAAIAAANVPAYTCDAPATYERDGESIEGSLHGFLTPRTSGDPCEGVAGVAKGTACTGKIR